jgi:DNA-binding transcriptional ArsR family regulator
LTSGVAIFIYLNLETPPEGIGKGGVAVDLTKLFKALGNRRRRAVFQAVWKGSGERHGAGRSRGVSVGEVARRTGLPQPTVSLYLQRLVEAGLVRTGRAERAVLCTVEPAALEAIARFARNPGAFD